MKISNFNQALEFVYARIPLGNKKLYPGALGVDRVKHCLNLLDNPQEKLNVIHIAGTSGKGSTSYLISELLRNHSFKVGLNISPHLLNIRERFQVNGQMISEETFIENLNQILGAIEQTDSVYGQVTYAETLGILAFYSFFKLKVDFAVIETSLGGLLDLTNVVSNPKKIAVITRIGHDHTKILGLTLDKIAFQKAGIIQPGNRVVALCQPSRINKVIISKCLETQSPLIWVKKGKNYMGIKVTSDSTEFSYKFTDYRPAQDIVWKKIKLGLIGAHQAENASMALGAFLTASQQYKIVPKEEKVREAFSKAHFIGRLDIKRLGKKIIILDGAHNPQKMRSLTDALKEIYPNQRFNFLVSFKRDKNFKPMLTGMTGVAQKIFLSKFFTKNEWVQKSGEPQKMSRILKKLNFKNFEIIDDNEKAFQKAFQETKDILVVTGSIYFISEIYPLIKE